MGLFRKIVSQTRKPEGTLGKMMLSGMNSGHAKVADWGLSHLPPVNPSEAVDLGCGGGRNAGALLKRYPGARVTAVDYSAASVEKAKEYNREAIAAGRCRVQQGDVSELTLPSESYDLATAFETVYFWPGLEKCFRQVARILKTGGTFMICNESDGTDTAGLKYEKIIDGMKAHTTGTIETALKKAGFTDVRTDHHPSKPWITVLAKKIRNRRKKMKPDYKNWIPKGMIWSFGSAFLAMCAGLITAVLLASGTVKTVLMTVLGVLALISGGLTVWSVMMYRAFDYNGKRKMSSQIIEGTAVYVKLPQGGKCLDVGCGSGALSIAVAKKNPKAFVIGVDRWGKEYASFSKGLCERNARAEGVTNAIFQQGDATHLVFPDEYFDAVTSNYVYHNIPGDRQAFLTETLRTLKKGGCFAIHDIMSASKYGNMQAFVKKLKGEGYEEVKLIDTANGMFMKKSEACWMGLSGSALLIGKK